MGATLGVAFLDGTLVTRGTSFQFSELLALGGGGARGVEFRGGPAIGGGPVGMNPG